MKQKNKKANALMTIIIVVAFFMFAILLIGLIFPDIAIARSSNNLDCSNVSISDGNKIACLGVDIIVPGFIIFVILIGGGAIVLKLTMSSQ